MFKVQNCMVVSNYLEGLHFSGSHGVSVQDTWICGAWGDGRMATGNGIGFHVPPDAGYGDNAEVLNCQISYCTTSAFNEELMLKIFGGNWEDCGCYLNLGGVSLNTVKGLYVLDQPHDWNSGFAALVRIDNADAPVSERTSFENCYLSGNAGRRAFSVLDSTPSSGFLLPHLIGGGGAVGAVGDQLECDGHGVVECGGK